MDITLLSKYLIVFFSLLITISCTSKIPANKHTTTKHTTSKHSGDQQHPLPFFKLNGTSIKTSANFSNWNHSSPWKIPTGYTQTLVSDESHLNIYPYGKNDLPDMNTVNETGIDKGRYLYRTHEISHSKKGAAISVVDMRTSKTKILVQAAHYKNLDGLRWTPWGTLVCAEENHRGYFYEVILSKKDPTRAVKVLRHPALGRLTHEGIEIDSAGNIYVVDEHRGRSTGCAERIPCGGGIYKFIPNKYGDLSQGTLYVLGFKEKHDDNTGQASWLGPIDPNNPRISAADIGGASYQRPEDLQIIKDTLYIAITEGPHNEWLEEQYQGRVISLNLQSLVVKNFVKPGLNVPIEKGLPGNKNHQTGLDGVDNLAKAPNGDLVLVEDNKPSDIWFASTQTDKRGASIKVALFASLTDPGAEGTGIYFSPTDPNTLYVNVQHSALKDGDGTWAITKK